LGQVRFGQVRFGQVRFDQVRFGQVRFGQVRLGFLPLVPLLLLGPPFYLIILFGSTTLLTGVNNDLRVLSRMAVSVKYIEHLRFGQVR
jgi:hypothetical protein